MTSNNCQEFGIFTSMFQQTILLLFRGYTHYNPSNQLLKQEAC